MKPSILLLLLLSLSFAIVSLSSAQNSTVASSCASYKFSDGKQFDSCNDLPYFNASLHWNYRASSSSSKDGVLVDVAYRRSALTERSWVAWAINPSGPHMVGCQALIAIPRVDGSVHAYTSAITSYRTALQPGELSFPVFNLSAMSENNEMIIFATLQLPLPTGNNTNNSMSHVVNQVWQEGPLNGDTPLPHHLSPSSPNMKSFGTVDFLSGKTVTSSTDKAISRRTQMKYAHAALNAASWGLMMPLGALVARYMKAAGPVWFYFHIGCQLIGSVMGIVGFSSGVYMAVKYGVLSAAARAHMGFGVVLVSFVVAQVGVGMFARPDKESERRKYFNWFHYIIGYSTILVGIGNIFLGFNIFEAARIWMDMYAGVIGFFGTIAVILELYRRCCCFHSAIRNDASPVDQV